jgi:hypothetical protein
MKSTYYQYRPEVWDAKTCAKKAKHLATDGLGTPYGFLGYIGSHYGQHTYNGGTIINGEWYQGENKPLPEVAPGFQIVRKPTWGWQIVRLESI